MSDKLTPFPCNVCKRGFATAHALKVHMARSPECKAVDRFSKNKPDESVTLPPGMKQGETIEQMLYRRHKESGHPLPFPVQSSKPKIKVDPTTLLSMPPEESEELTRRFEVIVEGGK